MKKSSTLTLLATTVLITTGCIHPFQSIYCSDETVTVSTVPTATFTEVEFSQQCEAVVTKSDSFTLTIEISENIREHLDVEKVGSRVRFSLQENCTYQNLTFKVTIGMPELDEVEASGASSVTIGGFESEREFTANLSGASTLDGSIVCGNASLALSGASRAKLSIDCGTVDFNISGASTIECNGTGGDLRCDVSGASKLRLRDLSCEDVAVDLSGASSMYTSPSGTIRGELSGASMLYYYGSPTLGSCTISGASAVRKAE